MLGSQFRRIGDSVVKIDKELRELLHTKWTELRVQQMQKKELLQFSELSKDFFEHIEDLESDIKDVKKTKNKEKLRYLRNEIKVINSLIKVLEKQEIATKKEEVKEISLTEALRHNVKKLEKELNKL